MSATAPQTSTDHNENLTFIIQKQPLQQAVDQLKTICSEAIFRIGRDGLSVSAIGPAQVAMVSVDVDADAFEHVGDGMFAVGIDLISFDNYLDSASSDDLVQLAFDEEKRRLNIQHTNVDVDMAGIDPDAVRQEPESPDLPLDATFTLEGGDLQQAVDHADLASDQAYFTADGDEGELRIVGKGDTDIVETAFERDDMIDGSFPEGETVALYSINYLNAGTSKTGGILNPIPKDAEVTGKFGDEYPIKVFYEWADGNADAELMVSPRLQSQ